MFQTIEITVSLATYKAIEAQRRSFAETRDDIIRRVLKSDPEAATAVPTPGPAVTTPSFARRIARRRGSVRLLAFAEETPVLNLIDGYIRALGVLARRDPALLDTLSAEGSAQRRWVARDARALYATAPHLAERFACEITPGWFADTNVSRPQILSRLETACARARLTYGRDLALLDT